MSPVFADTVFFVALPNERDRWHASATSLAESARDLVAAEHVLVETGNILRRSRARAQFQAFIASLAEAPHTRIVPASDPLFRAGLAFFGTHVDKDWSQTDRISFVVLRQQAIHQALTADRHFEQAGFDALML